MPGPPAQLRLARSLGPTYDRRLIEGTSSFRPFTMNDVVEATADTRRPVVRPRDAASLILLRGDGRNLEVLAGRRPLTSNSCLGCTSFRAVRSIRPTGSLGVSNLAAMCWG